MSAFESQDRPSSAYKGRVLSFGYAAYGLFAFAVTPGRILWALTPFPRTGFVTSTFINPNSFATYAGLGLIVICGLLLRLYRNWSAGRFRAVRITYPDGRVVTVPTGFSVLEASRLAGVPHASVCGGRGRCSTCRVRIEKGLAALPPPAGAEAITLKSIEASDNIRLACQIRPSGSFARTKLTHS